MRLCVIAHIFPARSETFVLQHVLGMRRRGHDVTVLAKTPDESMSSEECEAIDRSGIKRVYIGEFGRPKVNLLLTLIDVFGGFKGKNLLARGAHEARRRHLIAQALGRQLEQLAPDVLHVHFGTIGDDVLGTSRGAKLASRSVVTWHGYDFNSRSVVAAHDGYSLLRCKDVVHTVGTQFSAGKLTEMGFPAARIRKIPMGIDLAKFQFHQRDYADTSALRMLCVGRMVEVKGHAHLIRAVGEARSMGVPAHLRIIGDGPLRGSLLAQVTQLGLQDHVHLLGALPSEMVLEEMNQAHLFVLTGVEEPSGKVENQGTVYCEAAATGLPAIGSKAGGVPEAVIDDVTGKLCRPGDHEGVAAAMQFFHNHRDVMAMFGENARRHAEDNFSLENMLDEFESLYVELANTQ